MGCIDFEYFKKQLSEDEKNIIDKAHKKLSDEGFDPSNFKEIFDQDPMKHIVNTCDVMPAVKKILGDNFPYKEQYYFIAALMAFLLEHRSVKDQTFYNVIKLMIVEFEDNAGAIRNQNILTTLDRIFEQIKKLEPKSVSLLWYKTYIKMITENIQEKGMRYSVSKRTEETINFLYVNNRFLREEAFTYKLFCNNLKYDNFGLVFFEEMEKKITKENLKLIEIKEDNENDIFNNIVIPDDILLLEKHKAQIQYDEKKFIYNFLDDTIDDLKTQITKEKNEKEKMKKKMEASKMIVEELTKSPNIFTTDTNPFEIIKSTSETEIFVLLGNYESNISISLPFFAPKPEHGYKILTRIWMTYMKLYRPADKLNFMQLAVPMLVEYNALDKPDKNPSCVIWDELKNKINPDSILPERYKRCQEIIKGHNYNPKRAKNAIKIFLAEMIYYTEPFRIEVQEYLKNLPKNDENEPPRSDELYNFVHDIYQIYVDIIEKENSDQKIINAHFKAVIETNPELLDENGNIKLEIVLKDDE